MAKFLLEEEYEFDFTLLGISSHVKDYRLCWAVNKALDLDLIKLENEIIIRQKNGEHQSSFSIYYYLDEDNEIEFELICNRDVHGYLIPELKSADYFLKISEFYDGDIDDLVNVLRKTNLINMAFKIDVDTLRSKQNLLYI
jgi:hypothetical protein